jgi:hypothetical protein
MSAAALYHRWRAARLACLANRIRRDLLLTVEAETSRERNTRALSQWHAEMAGKPAATMPANREISPVATVFVPRQGGDSGHANKTRIRAILEAIPCPARRHA